MARTSTNKELEKIYTDHTEERKKRCMPIIQGILKTMLDKDLMINDTAWIEQQVLMGLEKVLKNAVLEVEQEIMKVLVDSLRMSLDQAIEMKIGKKREDLTLGDIDKIFKEEKPIPTEATK